MLAGRYGEKGGNVSYSVYGNNLSDIRRKKCLFVLFFYLNRSVI